MTDISQPVTKCNHLHTLCDWNDKFILGWDDIKKKWDKKFIKKGLITKYWNVKCNGCEEYVPEYAIHYPKEL